MMSNFINWLNTNSGFLDAFSVAIALLSLLATLSITLMLDKIRKKSDTMQNTNALNRQWQDFNLHMISNPKAYQSLRDLGYENGTDEIIRQRHIVYYILNMLFDTWHLCQSDSISADFAKTTIRGQLRLLSNNSALVLEILADEDLYDDKFRNYCLKTIKDDFK